MNNFEQLSDLELPAGSWVRNSDGVVVAWISDTTVDEELRQRVLAAWPTTGLWPLVATGLGSAGNLQPWHTEELEAADPNEPRAEDLDAVTILAQRWDEVLEDFFEFEDCDDEEAREWQVAAFALAAPTTHANPTSATMQATAAQSAVLSELSGDTDSSGYLLLVPVREPADAIAALGWFGACNYDVMPEELSAVAKSWQDRFGATLVGIGQDTLTFELPGPLDSGQAGDMVREYIAIGSFESPTQEEFVSFRKELATETQWLFWWD